MLSHVGANKGRTDTTSEVPSHTSASDNSSRQCHDAAASSCLPGFYLSSSLIQILWSLSCLSPSPSVSPFFVFLAPSLCYLPVSLPLLSSLAVEQTAVSLAFWFHAM